MATNDLGFDPKFLGPSLRFPKLNKKLLAPLQKEMVMKSSLPILVSSCMPTEDFQYWQP